MKCQPRKLPRSSSWTPSPRPQTRLSPIASDRFEVAQERDDALGWGRDGALDSRRSHGTILGIETREGGVLYPVFQFRRRGGRVQVHPNLVPVLRALKGIDSWTARRDPSI